jgi:hypothetical protein
MVCGDAVTHGMLTVASAGGKRTSIRHVSGRAELALSAAFMPPLIPHARPGLPRQV